MNHGIAESNVVVLEEYREEAKKHPLKFKIKEPPVGDDWLTPMTIGTEFLVRPRPPFNAVQTAWILRKFMHGGVKYGNVLVIPMLGEHIDEDDRNWVWTHGPDFCKFWEFMGYSVVPVEEDE